MSPAGADAADETGERGDRARWRPGDAWRPAATGREHTARAPHC